MMSQTSDQDRGKESFTSHWAAAYDLPREWHVDVVNPRPAEPLPDPDAYVAAALQNPLNTPPLPEMAGPGDQVCIAFNSPGTSSPDRVLVPAILRELERAGVRDEDIVLLGATGLQGRTSHEQKIAHLGATTVERYRVIDHDVGKVIHLGQWQGIPLTMNLHALEADLLISTGTVAPHLYAGYSGGAETLAIGCAGEATIEAIHSPGFLYNPQVRPAQVRGNPFQEILQLLSERAGLRFILNSVLDPLERMVDVQAGDPAMVHQRLVFSASSLYNAPVSQTYDVVIAGVDAPYDASLYQAIMGALFVGMAPNPVVRPGGAILVPARTPEAVGQGINAQNFFSTLHSVRSPNRLVSELLEQGYHPGEARAFQLARLMEQNQIIVVGSEFPAMVRACNLHEAPDMAQAVDLLRWLLGDDLDVLIIPHALYTMPIPPASEPDAWQRLSMPDWKNW
jgi:lactate racemase